jgi:hypothetical protein
MDAGGAHLEDLKLIKELAKEFLVFIRFREKKVIQNHFKFV